MAMKRVLVSIPEEMERALEKERKDRMMETLPETIRVILSEYLRKK
jgi:metal-responsive CopG/Arc/MetJ family transcriptional regulator